MTTNQIIALGFPLAAAAAGATALLVKRLWSRNPESEPIDPEQIDISVAMTNIQEAMKEIERANLVAQQKRGA
jgi:hypothetical protein